MIRNLLLLVSGALLAFYFSGSMKSCTYIGKYDTLSVVSDTQYIPVETKVYKKGRDIVKDTTIYLHDTVLGKTIIDTVEVVKEYFATNVYSDTLRMDSVGFIALRDTITNNKIQGRYWHAIVNQVVETRTVTLREKPKTSVIGSVFYNNGISGTITIQKPNKVGLMAGMGTNGPVLGLTFKIK